MPQHVRMDSERHHLGGRHKPRQHPAKGNGRHRSAALAHEDISCCRDSRSSLRRRVFSIAITRLGREVLQQRNLLAAERLLVRLEHRHAQNCWRPLSCTHRDSFFEFVLSAQGHDSRMRSVHLVWMDLDEGAGNVDFCLNHVGQFLRCLFSALDVRRPSPPRPIGLVNQRCSSIGKGFDVLRCRRTGLDARSHRPRPHGRSRVTLLVLAVFGARCDRCRCRASDKHRTENKSGT